MFFSFLRPIVDGVAKAQEVYYAANGEYSSSFENLDITVPEGGTLTVQESGEQINYPDYVCRIQSAGRAVYCTSGTRGYYRIDLDPVQGNVRKCYINLSSSKKDLFEKVCKSLGGVEISSNVEGWKMYQLP